MTDHVRHDNTGSRGCARCGHCCAPVFIRFDLRRALEWYRTPNPNTEEGAAEWARRGWRTPTDADKQWARQAHESKNIAFANEHWTIEWHTNHGASVVTCDQFDPEHRVCTAGESRPPICSDYPFYGEDPTEREGKIVDRYPNPIPWGFSWKPVDEGPGGTPLSCSYLGDVPPELRPAGAGRPLLPLWPVDHQQHTK